MIDWRRSLESLGPIAYLAPDLSRTVGFAHLLPQFMAVVADTQGVADRVAFPTMQVAAAEEGQRSSGGWLSSADVQLALRDFGARHLLFFKATHQAVEAARALGLGVLAGNPGVAQRFEHKVKISQLAAEEGWPTPPTLIFPDGMPESRELPWQLPLVVQAARGHSGQSTHLVHHDAQFHALRRQLAGRSARVSPQLYAPTVTVNGVAFAPHSVVVAEPYLQITGLPECTPHALGACGNIWRAGAFDDPAVRALAEGVGLALAREGYRGAYGVDLLLSSAGPLFVEVNPRVVSGLSLEALLYAPHSPPPAALHILATAPPTSLSPSGSTQSTAHIPSHVALQPGQQASQLVFYTFRDGPLIHSLQSGRHRLVGGPARHALETVSPSIALGDCAPNEGVLWVRSPGTLLKAGSEWARLQFPVAHLESACPTEPAAALRTWAAAVRGAANV